MRRATALTVLVSVVVTFPLFAGELRVESPPGIGVTYAMLTAPFTISDLPGGNKERRTLTAIVLNYDAQSAPLTFNLTRKNVFAFLGDGKKVDALYFVVAAGWNIDNTGEPGSMTYKQLTVESGGSKQILNAVGFESIDVTCDCKQNYAWFLFPIDDATKIARASLGNVRLTQP